MGAACCIAARDRTIHHESSSENVQYRNLRHSPSWSFRRDSRVGVSGEDISIGWLSNVASRSDARDVKSAAEVSLHTSGYQESSKNFRSSAFDKSITRNATIEVKTEDPHFPNPASLKQQTSTRTTSSSLCISPRVKLPGTSGQSSSSISMDSQTCGICSKLLSEKSVPRNELSVVSVLMCGHVYHAECLENVTPEIYKYDPACPVCTFGEKQILKLSRKMLKAEKDLKSRKSKRTRNEASDDYTRGSSDFDDVKSPKLVMTKPFLKRHFSLGSRGNNFASESKSNTMKGLFWTKSTRE